MNISDNKNSKIICRNRPTKPSQVYDFQLKYFQCQYRQNWPQMMFGVRLKVYFFLNNFYEVKYIIIFFITLNLRPETKIYYHREEAKGLILTE